LYKNLLNKISSALKQPSSGKTFPAQEFAWISEEGLLQVVLPGENLDFDKPSLIELLQLFKALGSVNLSIGRIYEGHINALHLIYGYGTNVQKEIWFNDVKNDHRLFGVWNTQFDNGIEIHELPNGNYRLEGSKVFCSGAHWITRPLITGRLNSKKKQGWQMCIVPVEKVSPIIVDSSFWKPMGMKQSCSYKMDFTGIELTKQDMLGAPDDYYKEPFFNGGAVRFAAVQLGGAMAVVEETHLFLKKKNRTGSEFQKARIAEMAILLEAGDNWLNSAGSKMDNWAGRQGTAKKNMAYAGMVRTAIENICSRILYLSAVCTGASGLMENSPLEQLHRDLTFFLKQPGPDAVLLDTGNFLFENETLRDVWK
jgi:alkylation response protein AidB-like acyl-CoA dehydrogenase